METGIGADGIGASRLWLWCRTGVRRSGSSYYYSDPYYYDDSYAYAPDGYVDDGQYAAVPASDSDAAYCAQRYKSYDPASGTYLNYDGNRYPCP